MGAPRRTPLSHSRLEQAACLFRFNEVVIKKAPQPKGEPAMKGGLFHEAASRFLRDLKARDGVCADRVALMDGIFEDLWNTTRPAEQIALDEGGYDDLRELALRFAREEPFGPSFQGSEIKLAVNDRWERVDWMADDAYFRLIIDRLDVQGSRVIVTDYKTSWRADSQDEVERSPQFRGYAAGIASLLPEASEIEVRANFVRPRITRSVVLRADQLDAARARVARESARIERAKQAKEFPASPGQQCAWCPVFDRCPLKGAAKEFRAPESDEDVKAVLAAWQFQKRTLDQLTGWLQAWAIKKGPIEAAGLRAEYERTQQIEYPGGAVLHILEELGHESPGDFLKGDRRRLESAAKKSEKLAEALERIKVVKPQSRWSCGAGDDQEVF